MPGSLEPGAMEQRALRMPSPLLLRPKRVRRGVAMAVGQRTRGDGEGRKCRKDALLVTWGFGRLLRAVPGLYYD